MKQGLNELPNLGFPRNSYVNWWDTQVGKLR